MRHDELEEYARIYLARLDVDWDAAGALIAADQAILPILVRAFRAERDPTRKAEILQIIYQHRQPAAIPVLSEVLYDPSQTVWKEALDGLVTLKHPDCVTAIESARGRTFEREKDRRYFLDYLDEASISCATGNSIKKTLATLEWPRAPVNGLPLSVTSVAKRDQEQAE